MSNWYKKAQDSGRSRMVDDLGSIIKGPDMSVFDETKLEKAKNWLERKYPTVNWTIDMVYEWINKNFIGKQKRLEKPKDLLHRF